MSLFDWKHRGALGHPLAERMRPRKLDEFIGQSHIIGPGRLLRRAIEADQLSSVIFSGPPGTGKTTLARVIANSTRAHFLSINAVLAGVKDIREAIDDAKQRLAMYEQRSILFVDEVHRFNKAQQDALLPWVENGTFILIGATTENPFFEVNKALVSRSRVFVLRSLESADLERVIEQALSDPERGYGIRRVELEATAKAHLIDVANGDARALLNALELAVETTPPSQDGVIHIDLAVAEDSIQARAVLYDKEGDAHFDTISAFIKSVRGSDPDAALYWLACMIHAGENPNFVFRRLLILAAEDVGLADPAAISVVESCAAAFDRIGLPEGRYHLAHATLYLATAPKSNSTMAFFDALEVVQRERQGNVPGHLKDGGRDGEALGHGANYLYPHAYRDHWVAQQYLPTGLQGRVFYQPSDQGYEGAIRDRLERRRETQLAAALEPSSVVLEGFSYTADDSAAERWVKRALSNVGEGLGRLRDTLFELLAPARHELLLELDASNAALLFWEGLRRVPEGGVHAWFRERSAFELAQSQVQRLPELRRPTLSLHDAPWFETNSPLRFELVVGRNVLGGIADKRSALEHLRSLVAPGGRWGLSELLGRQTPRLCSYVQARWLSSELLERWREAEQAIYTEPSDPRLNWSAEELVRLCEDAGFAVEGRVLRIDASLLISPSLLGRWFPPTQVAGSYRERLSVSLEQRELEAIELAIRGHLLEQSLPWSSEHLVLVGR
ncbi:MAG: AAA family ATPase [Myxococcota bacterium]|jgi:putative ATPase|nr:AAA family ATPase [Myxococcota bacterium]